MKFLKYILIITILVSCKSTVKIIDGSKIAKKMSARRVVKKHIAAHFDQKTVDAKFRVHYKDKKTSLKLSLRMKIIKDEVIWLKATKLITAFRAKITPTTISYYSPLNKTYFEGDFSMSKELLGVEINFEQLQSLLLGEAIADLKDERQEVEIKENTHVLSPKNQSELFSIFFFVNPSHYKLDKQTLISLEKKQQLDILYPQYTVRNNVVFPDQINIKASQEDKTTEINLTTKSIVFNTDVSVGFRIPSGYKQLKF